MGINQDIEEIEVKNISVEDFAKLDFSKVTLLDLREKDQVLVAGIEGAINIPFSQISKKLSKVPKDLPVYVFCTTGDWSEEVAEILLERGYDTYNVVGGFKAYKEYIANIEPVKIDAKELKCPGPIVKVADAMRNLTDGQKLFVEATEDAFASDIAVWCNRTGNHLEKLEVKPDVIEATIEKRTKKSENAAVLPDGKTFVVFSGDLDKTIAAFIMANGAAAMGREVTIFFTFWGLNILRRPNKVKTKKTLIEKMFGIMMPRGTKKLGLSRMNMGGAGAKMIRAVMKSKGVSSLEELIQNAIDHGVRLVACQMSMEIMGIKKEELIDGVELGGVATFLGSGEQSNMSLFI
ncbi:MAG: DsrE/DsrF/DrsH-like family protein [Lachnospiraceae bacterium]|nr:DsrE/DsrF/DrsH-like family protein [Lachnospiraceae bacterium]